MSEAVPAWRLILDRGDLDFRALVYLPWPSVLRGPGAEFKVSAYTEFRDACNPR